MTHDRTMDDMVQVWDNTQGSIGVICVARYVPRSQYFRVGLGLQLGGEGPLCVQSEALALEEERGEMCQASVLEVMDRTGLAAAHVTMQSRSIRRCERQSKGYEPLTTHPRLTNRLCPACSACPLLGRCLRDR
jgi:hypothetical protein